MAGSAVLDPRITKIVEGWWRRAGDARVIGRIRVAFQALQVDLRPVEHPGIGRAVRLVAAVAALLPNRSMFKDERAALVAVTLEASRFVRAGGGEGVCQRFAMRIVTVGALDGA